MRFLLLIFILGATIVAFAGNEKRHIFATKSKLLGTGITFEEETLSLTNIRYDLDGHKYLIAYTSMAIFPICNENGTGIFRSSKLHTYQVRNRKIIDLEMGEEIMVDGIVWVNAFGDLGQLRSRYFESFLPEGTKIKGFYEVRCFE